MEIKSKYNPKEVEPKILQMWLAGDYFHALINYETRPFSIVIPPPNITGILHMGHALNNTIQDVLIRYKRMCNFQALWMPGTDHAGIATQNVVEKELTKEGLKKEDVGRAEFLKRLWKWKDSYGSTIINQLKKLGASCDWARTRFTMDDEYSQAVKEVFIKLYEKGLVYRGNYIINWCPRCMTALSDEEVAHREIDGWLYYIKYPVQKTEGKEQKKEYVVVATTRPETMLGDTAVAINPNDKRYQWLKNVKVILPVVERELKVIEDEVIDLEFGTGVVKVTPAHDPVDFMLGKKYNLDFVNIMNDNAALNRNVPDDFIGMDRFEAREALLEILEEKRLIEKKEPYKLSAGHCYRCHTIIEPRISRQWFVKMKPLAQRAIKVVEEDKVKFYPQRWKKVYLNWMYNIQDWCISRQIWWGHRIPVWYCRKCQKGEDNTKGLIVSQDKPGKCPDCGSTGLIQDTDVLDTWFSSWLWPFATFGWPFREETQDRRLKSEELHYFYPTDTLVTASEILFFWVARMIMAGLEFVNEIPFKDVIIHGTVRDDRGIKMSKSLGNIIDPLDIIDKFGADALRFSLMMLAASGSDVYLNEDKFLVGRNFSNKIWNATRLILLKIKENNLAVENFDIDQYQEVDKWILEGLNQTIGQVSSYLDRYSLNEAAREIYDFFWHVFCDWYLEIVKDDFTLNRAKVLIQTLLSSIKMLHPFMPFISEEIHQLIKDSTKLHLDKMLVKSQWPEKLDIPIKKDELKGINALLDTIKAVRNIKIDLGFGQKKVKLQVNLKTKADKLWRKNIAWIKRLILADEIVFKDQLKRVLYENDFCKVDLDIESADVSTFLASLNKRINNLDNVLSRVSARLKNEKFLKNASGDTITKEKDKFDDITTTLQRLKSLKNAFK